MTRSSLCLLGYLRELGKLVCAVVFILAIQTAAIEPLSAGVTYNQGSEARIDDSSLINARYQFNSTPAALSADNQSAISVNEVSTGSIYSTLDNSNLYSSVTANDTTMFTRIELLSGNDPDSSLSSVNIQENETILVWSVTHDTSVTSTLTNLSGNSSGSLTDNSISAQTTLNRTSQTVRGTLNTSLDNPRSGETRLRYGSETGVALTGDAGILLASAQTTNLIPVICPCVPAFANDSPFAWAHDTDISLTAGGELGEGLTLAADGNAIEAVFTSNKANNVLAVESGGGTSLETSAAIANVQVNENLYNESMYGALVDNSGISAAIPADNVEDEAPFTGSSLSFDGNQIEASASGNIVVNNLTIAESVNVEASGGPVNTVGLSTEVWQTTSEGGLVLGNLQVNEMGSDIHAAAIEPAGSDAALSVSGRGLLESSITAVGNSFDANAVGNDAYNSINVDGATSFNGSVVGTNLQVMEDSPVYATAMRGALSVSLGRGTDLLPDLDENSIIASNVSVRDNTIGATAVGNRDPLLINVSGTTVADGSDQLANTRFQGENREFESSAGISALSGQSAEDSNVTASNLYAGVTLSIGASPMTEDLDTDTRIADSAFVLSGNRISSLGNLNEGLVAVGMNANTLDAMSAAVSVQNVVGSNASATTSGTISAMVDAQSSESQIDPGNLSIQVGDSDPNDGVNNANTISSTAGGNLNASSLKADADAVMRVTNAIQRDNPAAAVLALNSSVSTTDMLRAEMSVLTDQRMKLNAVSALTETNRISGTLRISSNPIHDATLNVDGNLVSASARGNLTDNSLNFSALSVDMSGTLRPDARAGSNLAAMGAVQVIDETGAVTAEVESGTEFSLEQSEILALQSGRGDLVNFDLSASSNTVEANATGNSATSTLDGTGGTLAQDTMISAAGDMNSGFSTTGPKIYDTAVANGLYQENGASVTAELANRGVYEITALTGAPDDPANYDKTITDSAIGADNNRAVALAVGSRGETNTSLDFTVLESSGAAAVRQLQEGSTIAAVGTGSGGLAIGAMTADNTRLNDSTMRASGNTAGARATGTVSNSSLSAGGGGTVTLASGYRDHAPPPSITVDTEFLDVDLSADFMLNFQQIVSGTTAATADNISVSASGGALDGVSLEADSNFVTAQTIGADSTSRLSLASVAMTAGGAAENTVNGILAGQQKITDSVTADLTNSEVSASAINSADAVDGTSDADAISVDDNILLASGTGLKSNNTLTTQAGTGVGGGGVEPSPPDGGLSPDAGGFDRLIVSYQEVGPEGSVSASSENTSVSITVAGDELADIRGDVEGDSLTVDRNALRAQAVGAESTSSLETTAGASIASLSQGIVSGQILDATVTSANTNPDAWLAIGGTAADSSLSLSENQFTANAVGLRNTNNLDMSADTSITDNVDTTPANDIIFSQQVNGSVDSALTDSDVYMAVNSEPDGGKAGVGAVSIRIDNNLQEASSRAATGSHTLDVDSGAVGNLASNGVGFRIQTDQEGNAPVSSLNADSRTTLVVNGGATDGSSLSVSGNTVSASAGNLSGGGAMTIDSGTANSGDDSILEYQTSVTADADRAMVSEQNVSMEGDVAGSVTGARMEIQIAGGEDSSGDLGGNSTARLDGNRVASSATVASIGNTLTNLAETSLDSSSLIGAVQQSEADGTATVLDTHILASVDNGVDNAVISLSDNQAEASATGLSATSALTVNGGAINPGEPIVASNGEILATPLDHRLSGFSAIGVDQGFNGDMTAGIDGFFITADVADKGANQSAMFLDRNRIQAFSTQAATTSTLSQQADTTMNDAPAMTAASQATEGTSGASVSDAVVSVQVSEDIGNSQVSVSENTANATATGGNISNDLNMSSGWIAREDESAGQIDSANTDDGSPSHHMLGNSLMGSEQVADGHMLGQAADSGMEVSAEGDGNVSDSAINVSGNRVEAASVMAEADNSLTQDTATEMEQAPAMVSAAQVLTGSSHADVSAFMGTRIKQQDISASSLSVDGNQIQAQAYGGNIANSLEARAGTHMGMDFSESTAAVGASSGSQLDAGYGISTRQESAAEVSGSIGETTEIFLVTGGDIAGNSALSLSGNTIRGQAVNLSVDNAVIVAAGTVMNQIRSGVMAYQEVLGTTRTEIGSAAVWARGGDLEGVADVDNNSVTAIALGGGVTNDLRVSGMAVTGGDSEAYTELEISSDSLTALAEGDTHDTLLNVQSRGASVIADMNDRGGYNRVSAYYESVRGSVSVDGNLIGAEARGLVGENSIDLNSETSIDSAPAALGSVQSGDASVEAHVDGGTHGIGFYLYAQDSAGTASLDGSSVLAVATSNLSVNELNVDAATQILAMETSTQVGRDGSDTDADPAAYALQSAQSGSLDAIAEASISHFAIRSEYGSIQGVASVDNNTINARARGQVAQNSLVLNAETGLSASAQLANTQGNDGAISSGIENGSVAMVVQSDATASVSVSGNQVQSSSTANYALNSMNITGGRVESSGGTVSADMQGATGSYVALNTQTNNAPVDSSVLNLSIGYYGGSRTNGEAGMDNNVILADATGNSATNTFTVESRAGFGGTNFAFTGYQNNNGAYISSTISNVSISFSASGATGSISATGNRIDSRATGNQSVSSVSAGN